MKVVANERNCSVAQVALAWLLHKKNVTTVICAARKIEQLSDNLKASDLVLSQNEMEKLDAASAVDSVYPNWMLTRQARDRLPDAPPRS